eukprot:s1435_g15.t1
MQVTTLAELVRAVAAPQEGYYLAAPLQEAFLTLLLGAPAVSTLERLVDGLRRSPAPLPMQGLARRDRRLALILCFCACPRANYVLCVLPPAATSRFAEEHDAAVGLCLATVLGFADAPLLPAAVRASHLPLQIWLAKRHRSAACALALDGPRLLMCSCRTWPLWALWTPFGYLYPYRSSSSARGKKSAWWCWWWWWWWWWRYCCCCQQRPQPCTRCEISRATLPGTRSFAAMDLVFTGLPSSVLSRSCGTSCPRQAGRPDISVATRNGKAGDAGAILSSVATFGHRLAALGLGLTAVALRRDSRSRGDGRTIVRGRNYETNIKKKKGPAERKQAKVTAKHLRNITMAVRDGGPDPSANSMLSRFIKNALKDNVPRDTVDRRIKAFTEQLVLRKQRLLYATFVALIAIAEDMLINAGANQHVPELPEAAGGRRHLPWSRAIAGLRHTQQKDGCHLLQFNKVLSALDKGDQWERAELVLQRAGGLRLEPDMYSLGAGLSALARHRHWAGATSVLQWGQKEKLQASEVIFNSLMSSCDRSDRWITAFDVFRTLYKALLQPSPASFSCWSRWPAAAEAIPAIRQEGLQPSQINQGVAMKAFQLAEFWQCAMCLMQETWKGTIIIDQVTTSSAMTALERGRYWKMALHLSGPGADVVRIGAEAAAAAAAGWLQALSWLRRAAELSLRIGVVAFGAILAACEKSGMWSLALQILRSMTLASVEENTITCNSVLSACEKAGQWSAAVAFLEACRSRRVATDALSQNAVISACEKAWHWRMATVLLPGSDEVGCNAAISACEKASCWHLAGAILCGMPWRRLLPTEVSHSSALTSYAKRQLWQGSLSLLRSMRRVLLIPNAFTYSAALTACASPTTWQQALGLLEDMRSDKVVPGGDLLVAVTSACSFASQFGAALDLLTETEEWLTDSRGRFEALTRIVDDEKELAQPIGRVTLNVTKATFTVKKHGWGKVTASKDIVRNVSLSMQSGHTLAGSSGSRTGYVDLNGKAMTPEVFKQYCAHVPQHDQGWPFLTCYETVQVAADFFVRANVSERRARADGILETMGLQSCRHKRVGNEYIKGLSGGQRRRLSLAVAFMKNPLVVFLDEVTSGLDAASAASITKFLQELARSEDVIIACTIHQPSARIKGFDKLLLLSGGRVAYSGPVEDAVGHFQKLGFSIPDHENPADFFLDSINADFTSQDAVEKVLTAWESRPSRVGSGSFDLDADITTHAGQHFLVEVWVLFFTQILQRMWLLLWHIGVPACMSLSTCLAQNMEFVAVKREVKSGMYRLSPPCAEKVFFSRHRSQLSSASTKRTRCCCFFFDCAAQLFAVTFSHPLLGLFQVICLWFASFLFAGILVSEEDVVWPLRVFAIVSPMKWSNQGNHNSPRGFSCPGLNELECWGVTGEQVLASISQSVAKNITPERELDRDCSILVGIANVFRLAYFCVAALRCQTGKAVKKPKDGSTSTKESFNELEIQGFSLGGAALIVDTMTDNTNRTRSQVTECFKEANGQVSKVGDHIFQKVGVLEFEESDEEKVLEASMEADAEVEDIVTREDGIVEAGMTGCSCCRCLRASV